MIKLWCNLKQQNLSSSTDMQVSLGPTKVINALYDDESGHDICFIIYLPSKRLMTVLLQQNLIVNDEPRFLWKPILVNVASSPRLSGIGMPSPILWSHLLKMQRTVLLSSLLWWELGTVYLITGPSELLSFRRFTIKLSWSWDETVRDETARVRNWKGMKHPATVAA